MIMEVPVISFKSACKRLNAFQFIFVTGFAYCMPAYADIYHGVISDSHTHIRSGVKFQNVIESMNGSNVDVAVMMSHDEDVTDDVILEFYKKYPERIIPAISFQHSRWKKQDKDYMAYVNKLAAQGEYHWFGEASLRGKIDGRLNMPPAHPMVHQLLQASIKYKIPVTIHHNSGNKQEIEAFIEVLMQHPEATVIWAHWCGLGTADRARELLDKLPNLYCDLAWLHKHQGNLTTQLVDDDNRFLPEWKKLIEEKPGRFMIGIDASKPNHYKTGKYIQWVKKARKALGSLNPEVAEMVGTRNLHKLLRR